MNRPYLAIAAIVGAAFVAIGAGPSESYKGEKLASHAKISMADARQIALKARPGKVMDEELEAEKGGSGFRYSFDVRALNTAYEVGVDARTGQVLENKAEGSHPD